MAGETPQPSGYKSALARFTAVQVVVQALALLPGLAVVRFVDLGGYALYTLAVSIEMMMAIVVEAGSASAVSGLGGQLIHRDRSRFAALLSTAARFRSLLGLGLLAALAAGVTFALSSHGASLPMAAAAAALVGASFWLRMRINLLSLAPRLLLDASFLQRAELWATLTRVSFVVVGALLTRSFLVALGCGLAGLLLHERLLARYVAAAFPRAGVAPDEGGAVIRANFRRELTNSLYFAAQGQLTTWLIAIFATTREVAELGALGRIAAVFLPMTAAITNVILPRWARLDSAGALWRRYWQLQLGVLAIGLASVALVSLAPGALLWILGEGYRGLDAQLIAIIAAAAWQLVVGVSWHLNVSRGWTQGVWLYAPSTLLLQVFLVQALPLHTLDGVILFGALSQLPMFLLSVGISLRGIASVRRATPVQPAAAA